MTSCKRFLLSSIPLLAMTLSMAMASEKTSPATGKTKPNIIIIFCDDMGYGDIGPFGAKDFKTPRLDQMAKEGMVFTDFHVAASVCSTSRAGLLTGCYPIRVGIAGNFHPSSKTGLNPEEVTFAEIVKQNDYATAMLGKWHLGHLPPFLPTQQGFDQWYGLPYSNDMWPFHPTVGHRFPDLPMMENEKIVKTPVLPKDQVHLTTDYTTRAVNFIDRNKDRPFLIYLAHAMPHVPLFVSDKFAGKSKRGPFGDVVSEIDWSTGQIIDALKRNDIDENTLIIFTSDNGPWLLYGNHAGSAGPLRSGKGSSFEGGFRVPCVMRWPGKIPAGKTCSELTASIDVLPTIAALAGASLPNDRVIDGKDIRPLMFGTPGARSPHQSFYYVEGSRVQAVRCGRWKLVLPHRHHEPDPVGSGGKPGKGKSVQIELALYDLKTDIGETKNLAAENPETVARLQKVVEQARADLKDRRPIGQLP